MTNLENENLMSETIKKYLFAEMNLKDTESFEEKLFLDDDFFHEVVDAENDLIDLYAAGKLSGAQVLRFEKSLEKFPERREKIANAVALQSFIAEEKEAAESAFEVAAAANQTPTLWEKLQSFFTMPALTFVMSGILVLFTVLSVFLVLDNQKKADELARLQNEGLGNESVQQQIAKDLRGKLSQAETAENQLQTKIDDQREATGELTEELERERRLREKLRRELEESQQKQNSDKPAETVQTPEIATPRVASIKLTPAINNPNESSIRKTSVGENTSLVAVNLSLPAEVKQNERFTVKLNDKNFLENVRAQTSSDGKKIISLTVQTKNLLSGKNKFSVIDANGKEITAYLFEINKQ